ncbi:type IV toxin-antitoxin system AbiEi family antitoxin domain-containing protein [bacterium]|nr:type IV toxin-antitoxin system AbiEi family antitoxin domain-containing protein [bacterium]
MHPEKIIHLFKKSHGYLKSTDLLKHGVHTSQIKKLVEDGRINRIKRGLYRLPPNELVQDERFTFEYFDAAVAVPKGIFCLSTALYYHGLTTTNPSVFEMAILPTQRNTRLFNVAVRFYRFQKPYFQYDVEEIDTELLPIKIYGKEKSVCDVIRMRHLVGEDIAMEGLNSYIRQSEKDINKLLETAIFCKIRHIVEPAVKAMIGF